MQISEAPAVPEALARTFQAASRTTGIPFNYLLSTAMRESALDPAAQAPTSSATGLFQFIEQTWLEMVKEEGPRHGLGNFASAIEPTASGGFRVDDPEARKTILALRADPETATAMAAEFTRRNGAYLTARLGRGVSEGELYAAHFLGPAGAGTLIEAAGRTPSASAAAIFPDQAAANRRMFHHPDGRDRTVGELYALLTGPTAKPAVATAAATEGPVSPVLGYAPAAGPAPAPAIPGRYGTAEAAAEAPRGRFAGPGAAAERPDAPPRSRFALAEVQLLDAAGGADEAAPAAPVPRLKPAAGSEFAEDAPVDFARLMTALSPRPAERVK